jgi:tRNA pseudouridine38-40 synthase
VTLFDAGGESPASRGPETIRLALVLAYDGTDFRGFAGQSDVRTVEGVLADALAKVLRVSVGELGLVCAGRTDAGVHAWGQVVTIDAPAGTAVDALAHTVNRITGPELVVRSVGAAPPGFDARRSAVARTYRYTIVNRPEPDPFLTRFSWWVAEPLSVPQLRLAADPFVGEHDFASFCRRGPEGSTTVRRVLESHWLPQEDDGVLVYEIRATAFCWQMVRSIVGTIVETGAGRRRAGEVMQAIRAHDRSAAGRLAPPQGLCLWRVDYRDSAR